MSKRTYYFVYRVPDDSAHCIPWGEPTGGIVLVNPNQSQAMDMARERYHCTPGETIVLAEVWGPEEKFKAGVLHRSWELERDKFLELMML